MEKGTLRGAPLERHIGPRTKSRQSNEPNSRAGGICSSRALWPVGAQAESMRDSKSGPARSQHRWDIEQQGSIHIGAIQEGWGKKVGGKGHPMAKWWCSKGPMEHISNRLQ
ncbi:unnamed protein product [Calypogeia fissa]